MKLYQTLFTLGLYLMFSASYAAPLVTRLPFAMTPKSLCGNYADTKWIGPQMGGGFHLDIEKNGEQTSRLYGDVRYYGGNFEFGREGNCVDNFDDDSVTISFHFGADEGYISVKAKGANAKTLTIVSGAMANHDDRLDKISGALTRV